MKMQSSIAIDLSLNFSLNKIISIFGWRVNDAKENLKILQRHT